MAVRTVSVELKMKISDFELAAAKAAAISKALGDDFDHMGTSANKFSTSKPTKEMQNFSRVINSSLKDGKTGFQSIQTAIDDTKTHIANLRSQIKTGGGSEGLFGDLRQSQKDLRTLEGIFKDIEPPTKNIANNLHAAGDGSRNLQVSLVNAAIQAAPFLAPVAAGSALALLAGAGVGLGILGQLKDPAVQAAAKSLITDLSAGLTQATSAFGPEIVKSLHIADIGISKFIGDLKPAFDSLAPETEKITNDFVHGLEKAGPALSKSMIAAKPDLEALSRLIGSLPEDAGVFFQNLSIGAKGGAQAIDDLNTAVKQLSAELGTSLGVIAQVYGAISTGSHWLDQAQGGTLGWATAVNELWTAAKQTLDPLGSLYNNVKSLGGIFGIGKKSGDDFNGTVQSLTGNLAPFTASTYGAAAAEQALYQSLTDTFDAAMNLDQANLGAAQGLADLSTAIKTNGKHWDENTQAGRNNMGQLLNSIDADKKAYDAQVAAGGATAGATKKYDAQVDKLLDLARQAGLSKGAIAKLKSEYESIPASKTFHIHVVVDGNLNQAQLIARETGQRTASRWGGIYQHAADGLLSSAQVYSSVNPGRFMIAEPQTGGEAFIPKRGDYGRSMNILSAAAGWYGAHVVGGSNGGGSQSGPMELVVTGGDATGKYAVETLRFAIQARGGNVIQVLTPR